MSTVTNTTNGAGESAFQGISQGPQAVAILGQGAASGVQGEGSTWHGVYGKTDSTVGGAGVMGEGVAGGPGVIGKSQHWHGVYGETSGTGESGAAAVWGENKSDGSGVVGHSLNGAGIYAKSEHGSAAVLDGKLDVRGDISVTGRVIGNVEIDGANHITGNVEIDGTLTVKGAALDPAKIWQALSDLQAEIGSLEAQVTELQAQIEALASK